MNGVMLGFGKVSQMNILMLLQKFHNLHLQADGNIHNIGATAVNLMTLKIHWMPKPQGMGPISMKALAVASESITIKTRRQINTTTSIVARTLIGKVRVFSFFPSLNILLQRHHVDII